MNDRAIKAIQTFLEACDGPLGIAWSQHQIEEVVYSRWACETVIVVIMDHPWTPAADTIESFGLLMMGYATAAVTEEQKRIFSIAANAMWELLEYIEEVET